MKKFASVISLVIIISLSLGSVIAFAGSIDAISEEAIADYGDIYEPYAEDNVTEEMLDSMLEEIIGEGAEELLPLVLISSFCILLFVPVLVVMIVFIVLKNKTKKKIREYENIYGPIPENNKINSNPYQNGGNPYGYSAYNNSGASENYSVPSYIPENNNPQENKQQGGQF